MLKKENIARNKERGPINCKICAEIPLCNLLFQLPYPGAKSKLTLNMAVQPSKDEPSVFGQLIRGVGQLPSRKRRVRGYLILGLYSLMVTGAACAGLMLFYKDKKLFRTTTTISFEESEDDSNSL